MASLASLASLLTRLLMRTRTRLVVLLAGLALVAVAVAGCGAKGYAAPTLGASTGFNLGSMGMVVFTPFYAEHVVTYYPSSQAVPYTNPKTPVQIRQGSCLGKVVAALTQGAPGPSGTAPVVQPAKTGVNVALAQDTNQYVTVLASPNDPNAKVLVCGHPLDGGRQYFDLFLPTQGANGYGRGLALMEPITASRVAISFKQPAASNGTWTLHDGTCSAPGATLATGQFNAGDKSAQGIVFSAPSSSWSLSIQEGSSAPVCASVG